MRKTIVVILAMLFICSACGTYRYVKKPWADVSIEQAEAICQLEAAKISVKGECDSFCQSNIMKACMKSKGWEYTYFPSEK